MGNPTYIEKQREKWCKTTRTMNNGMNATIVSYEKSNDISVLFEDGYVAEHKSISSFKAGQIRNPNVKRESLSMKQNRNKWIGCSYLMKNGQTATIIDYRGVYDIDVVFEDGFIAKNRTLCSFKNGEIKNPNIRAAYIQEKIGMERIMSNGMKAKIYQYRRCTDIDIIFEDRHLCKRCIHRAKNLSDKAAGRPGCDYICNTGEERGCDVECCNKFEEGESLSIVRQRIAQKKVRQKRLEAEAKRQAMQAARGRS